MKTFNSRIVYWLYLHLALFVALTVYFSVAEDFLIAGVFVLFAAIALWGCLNTKYVINGDQLIINPLGPSIPVKDITDIRLSSDYHYSHATPALLYKRIAIEYAGKTVFVSPEDEELFIQTLKEKCKLQKMRGAGPLQLQQVEYSY